MPKPSLINRTEIRAICRYLDYSRGQRYYEDGRVISLYQNPEDAKEWLAEVKGRDTYEVTLTIGLSSPRAHCTCPAHNPYHFCKHAAAALIAVSEYTRNHAYTPVTANLASDDENRFRVVLDSEDDDVRDDDVSHDDTLDTSHGTLGGTLGGNLADALADSFADSWTDPWEESAVDPLTTHMPPRSSGSSQATSSHQADPALFEASNRLLDLFRQTGRTAAPLGSVPPGVSTVGASSVTGSPSGPSLLPGGPSTIAPRADLPTEPELLQVEYICQPVTGRYGVAEHINLEMKVGPQKTYVVRKIREFLQAVETGRAYPFTPKFTYDPTGHRFSSTDIQMLQILFDVIREEALYNGMMGHYHSYSRQTGERALFLTPLIWKTLYPLLQQSNALLDGVPSSGPLRITTDPPPLHMQITKPDVGPYAMEVSGIDNLIPLPSYGCVIAGSTFHMLDPLALGRLIDLQTVVERQHFLQTQRESSQRQSASRGPAWTRIARSVQHPQTSEVPSIPIAEDALETFMTEVVPGLKRLGRVGVEDSIGHRIVEAPLTARVYLDRSTTQPGFIGEDVIVASVQFWYGDSVVDPLSGALSDPLSGPLSDPSHDTQDEDPIDDYLRPIVVRDLPQEARILQYLHQSGFILQDSQLILAGEEFMYEFVVERLPQLEQWVEVFATNAVDNAVRPAAIRPKSRIEVDSKTNWLEVTFDMGNLSNQEIFEVLQSMIQRKRYHRLRSGAFVSLQDEQFSELDRVMNDLGIKSSDLNKAGAGTASLTMPSIRALALMEQTDSLSTVKLGKSLRRWLDNLRNPDNIDVELPSGLNATLREYQKFGFQWMKTLAQYGFGGILADDMGLGKTIQTITFLLSEKESHGQVTGLPHGQAREQTSQLASEQASGQATQIAAPALIVCPASLTYNWKSEIDKFAPSLHAVVVTGDKAEREAIVESATKQASFGSHADNRPDVVITSYPLLWRDVDIYRAHEFSTLILDEAQAIKNHETQTAQAVAEIRSTHRFALTGTPVENSLDDLWSIFRAVFPALLGSRSSFGNLSPEAVAKRIRPFVLRRLKRDVLTELPDKIETLQTAELTKEQKTVYMAYLAQLQEDTLKGLETQGFQKGRFQILAGLTRLRQICCHPSLCIDNFRGNSGKLEHLLELVEEYLGANQKMLIFSQFTSMLDIIRNELNERGFRHFYLDGQTPAKERLELCDKFNRGDVPIFLISLKAGGTGLNLTGADTVILYDLWWNPAVEQQAADRAHRIGQKNTVQVIRMVTQGTIEEKMYELQEKKRNLIDTVVQANEEGLSALTEEDIRNLLSI